MQYPFQDDMNTTGVHFQIQPYTALRWFQVLGERASGTNIIRKLVFLNAKLLRTEGLGWKHGFPTMVAVPSHTLVICAVRNAENWALSMHKRPWHLAPRSQHLGFSEFIRAPWDGIVDRPEDFETLHPEQVPGSIGRPHQLDRHPITGKAFENLFALRRAKLASLVGMLERDISVALVQMETVTGEPEAFLQTFRQATNTNPKRDVTRIPGRRMGNMFNRSAPCPPTPKAMNAEDRAFMKNELDLELEAALGYHYD